MFIITPSKNNSKTKIAANLRKAGFKVSKNYTITYYSLQSMELLMNWVKDGLLKYNPETKIEDYNTLNKNINEKYIDTQIKNISVSSYDWGRKTNYYSGSRVQNPEDAKVRIKTVMKGRWVTNNYFADYYWTKKSNRVEYVLANGISDNFAVSQHGTFRFKGKVLFPLIKAESNNSIKCHHLRRLLKKFIPRYSGIQIKIVATDNVARVNLIDSKGQEYHKEIYLVPNKYFINYLKDFVRRAISAFRTRRKEAINFSKANLQRVFVSINDSFRAGNCEDTFTFANKMWKNINAAGECSVRADLILELRDDLYSKRAVQAAINRLT